MKADAHLLKARRIIEAVDRLDPAQDAIALIDAAMIAGYHLGNALLHACGASNLEVHWNTPSKLEIALDTLPDTVRSAYALFTELERLRSQYVRNATWPDAEVALDARRKLHAMAHYCGIDHGPGTAAR